DNRDVHLLAVTGENNVARPVATAGQASSAGQVRDDHLLRPTRFQIAHMIRKTDHRTSVANVDPLRVGTGRIKRYAKRQFQPSSKDLSGLSLAVLTRATKYLDLPRLALGQKKIAVGR